MATQVPARVGGAGLRKAAGGSRRSGVRAALFLGFALVAAVATAVVLTRYLELRTAAARVPTMKVVVAALDIPIATTLRAEALQVVDWPTASKPDHAQSDLTKLVGRVATTRILKGEPILEAKLASTEAGSGLAAILPEGMRAVAVRVDDVVGVAGFIHPSDYVDVIATMKPMEGSNAPPVSKIILQGVRVLAVGKDASGSAKSDKPVTATVATLMVNSEQSERLALAATKGQILLALRSRIDLGEVETSGIIPHVLLAGAPGLEGARPVPAKAAARAPGRAARGKPDPLPAVEKQTVEVIRGDLFEKRDFQKETRQ